MEPTLVKAIKEVLDTRIPVQERLEFLHGNRITIVKLRTMLDDEPIEAHGLARACPEDKPRPEVGELLALGRALQHLGRKLERRAWGEIKQANHVR